MFTTYAISLTLIGLSGILLDSHRRTWHQAQQRTELSERERRFLRSQYRRRMQASSIIGALGATIGMRSLVPREPWSMLVYLLALAGACGCIMLLAALDAWSTRQYFAQLRSEELTAQMKLARDLARAQQSTQSER